MDNMLEMSIPRYDGYVRNSLSVLYKRITSDMEEKKRKREKEERYIVRSCLFYCTQTNTYNQSTQQIMSSTDKSKFCYMDTSISILSRSGQDGDGSSDC